MHQHFDLEAGESKCVCVLGQLCCIWCTHAQLQEGGQFAAGPAAANEHELTVARLRHERAAREALLRQLDGLRAQKVSARGRSISPGLHTMVRCYASCNVHRCADLDPTAW